MEPEFFKVPHLESLYTQPDLLRPPANAVPTQISILDYTARSARKLAVGDLSNLLATTHADSVTWIDVQGLGSLELIERLGTLMGLHPMELADILNVPQRSQLEEFDDRALMVMHAATASDEHFCSQQVSLAIGRNYIATFQEDPQFDCFQSVRDRILFGKGHIRQRGADYLAFALIDAIVDSYFPVLEIYSDRLEALEAETTTAPTQKTLTQVHFVRRELLAIRRTLSPQRESLNALLHSDSLAILPTTAIYLRDGYSHLVQILETVEIYRELASGLVNLYLSAIGHRMNEVVKLLTIISTVFIPLTFLAGIYGMNFNPASSPWNMPELNWPLGYPLILSIMLVTATTSLALFWKIGWLKTDGIGGRSPSQSNKP